MASPFTTVVGMLWVLPAESPFAMPCCQSDCEFLRMRAIASSPHVALRSFTVPAMTIPPACGATHLSTASYEMLGISCGPAFRILGYVPANSQVLLAAFHVRSPYV